MTVRPRAGARRVFHAAALLIVALACLGCTRASAGTLPVSSAPAATFGPTTSIMGWVVFCHEHPEECTLDLGEPETITLDAHTWALVNAINRSVNETIAPVTDWELYGVRDLWTFPDSGKGDCEDYALLKRRLLAGLGLPRRAMLMTVVLDENGEGHAVLLLRTDRGDLVLDNKRDEIRHWYRTDYTFVKRESGQARGFVSLGWTRSPTTTAHNR